MQDLAGSGLISEEEHLKTLKKLTALFYIMPAHHLIYGNMCLENNTLKIHPSGMAEKNA